VTATAVATVKVTVTAIGMAKATEKAMAKATAKVRMTDHNMEMGITI